MCLAYLNWQYRIYLQRIYIWQILFITKDMYNTSHQPVCEWIYMYTCMASLYACVYFCHVWDPRNRMSYMHEQTSLPSIKSFVCGVAQTVWPVERHVVWVRITFELSLVSIEATPSHHNYTVFKHTCTCSTFPCSVGNGEKSMSLYWLRFHIGNVISPGFSSCQHKELTCQATLYTNHLTIW